MPWSRGSIAYIATGGASDESQVGVAVSEPAVCTIAVACLDAGLRARADALAHELGVPCIDGSAESWRVLPDWPFLLLVSGEGLALGQTGGERITPVRADFGDAALMHRLRGSGPRGEDVARALGVPERRGLRVVDATAGWGRDSAVLAALGCEVTMIERHPVVGLLLADALARAVASERTEVREIAARLRLLRGDAREVLATWSGPPPEAILLDPMFPERARSAAVRKEMRFFHDLIGDDADAPALLEAALALALHRVVVKRPRKAPALAGSQPSYAITGRSTRFDVYPLRRYD
ncbi:MAG: class I SAM-dependent methyltransferase [Gammaproteobacteria bacterium]|nr:class I SAM-dependent methyltransferase [Gammaproteobacteria bacterium]